jgi:hypothetical protein
MAITQKDSRHQNLFHILNDEPTRNPTMELTEELITKIKKLMDTHSVLLVCEDSLEYASYSSEGDDEEDEDEDEDENGMLHISTESCSESFKVGDSITVNGSFIVLEKDGVSCSLRFLKEVTVKI